MARILPGRMALAAASAAYVADPNKAQYLLSACHQLQSDGRTIHLSDAVLRAHWRTDAGMDTLHMLSVTYRIVPRPLGKFIDHCLKQGVGILDYLHPCSLFEDPELASRVYDYLGNVLGPRPEVLEVLWHLSSTRSSNAYAHHVLEMLHAGISEAAPSNAALLLTLASRYMDATQIALLDMGALGRLMVSGQGLTANIMSLARRMEPHQRVLLAKPMAYEAARTSDGVVIFQLQQLSRHPEFAVAVAAAVRSYQHRPYVDRLGIETSIQLVPYLIGSRAYTGLSRLAAARPRFAVSAGVYTALLSANRAVPAYPDAVAHPYAAHEVVHYVHRKLRLPPDRAVVDAAYYSCMQAADVLRKTSRRCPELRDYLLRVQRWRRRRLWVIALRRQPSSWPLLQWLSSHEFTWRLVFGFL